MIISEIRTIFNLSGENDETNPPVMLYECQKIGEDTLFIEKYTFIQKIIRLINIIPVFMRTNAGLSNFVSLDSSKYLRV
jgi:hypothetical protein